MTPGGLSQGGGDGHPRVPPPSLELRRPPAVDGTMRPLLPSVLLLGMALGCTGSGCADPAAPVATAVREALPGAHPARGGSLVIDPATFAAWIADADNHALYRVDLVSLETV